MITLWLEVMISPFNIRVRNTDHNRCFYLIIFNESFINTVDLPVFKKVLRIKYIINVIFFVYVELFWYIILKIKDRKSTRLNSSHVSISYAVFCLKKKKIDMHIHLP